MKDKTRNLVPPEHLNYFNPDSLSLLLESKGFETLSVETPGKLDVDIIRDEITKGLSLKEKNGFLVSLFQSFNDRQFSDLQSFLIHNKLSSHMLILAQKRD